MSPEFILLDIGMPGLSGYQVARRLRKSGIRSVLIAITGRGQQSDRAQAKEAGLIITRRNRSIRRPWRNSDVNGSTSNGTALEQYSCESNQYSWDWQFRSAATSGYYNVFNRYATALAWDDTGGSSATGNLIQLYPGSSSNANQEWKAVSVGNGMYNFVNLKSGLCLDDPGSSTSNGTQMQQYTCSSGNRNQEFSLVQVH